MLLENISMKYKEMTHLVHVYDEHKDGGFHCWLSTYCLEMFYNLNIPVLFQQFDT